MLKQFLINGVVVLGENLLMQSQSLSFQQKALLPRYSFRGRYHLVTPSCHSLNTNYTALVSVSTLAILLGLLKFSSAFFLPPLSIEFVSTYRF
jgi:hypothetical protein